MKINSSAIMATVTLAQEHNSYIVYNRQLSTDSGWENPFRPGGDLSREADQIVELIKEGKPITPTPHPPSPKSLTGQQSPTQTDNGPKSAQEIPITKSAANDVSHSPRKTENQQNANGSAGDKPPIGAVDVQRGTVVTPSDASQVEHVVIKKKPKCKCCVIQ